MKLITNKLLASCILLFTSIQLFARAGGGGGYSGGGGSFSSGSSFSSSSSSGYSGSYGSAGDLPSMIFMIIFFIIFLYMLKMQKEKPSRTIRKAFKNKIYRDNTQELSELKERDPKFSISAFEKRCFKPFVKIQQSWSYQNMTPVRAYISDGIYERFSTQIQMQKSSYRQNVMQNIKVQKTSLLAIDSNEHFDTIHLSISAQAIDYTINPQNMRLLGGSKRLESFSEVWSFIRKPSAQTLAKDGLLEGKCPSCSAKLKISDTQQCEFCDAFVNSGSYDWVLSEITQMQEFNLNEHTIPNLSQMREKDSALHKQHIEDKTSVIFWKEQASRFYANTQHLKKYAMNKFIEDNQYAYIALEDNKHKYLADAAVGSVDLLSFSLASDDTDMDRAHVLVKSSGHYETREIPACYPPEYDKSNYEDFVYVLARNADVTTPKEDGLSSLKCLSCGSPDRGEDSSECVYCGKVQNDGSLDWVLQDIQAYDERAYKQVPLEQKKESKDTFAQMDYRHKEAYIFALIQAMNVDGTIDPQEYKLLQTMTQKQYVSSKRLDQLINMKDRPSLTLPLLNEDDEKRDFFNQIIHMCLIDGDVSAQEKKLLQLMAKKLNFTQTNMKKMVKDTIKEIYKEAKAS